MLSYDINSILAVIYLTKLQNLQSHKFVTLKYIICILQGITYIRIPPVKYHVVLPLLVLNFNLKNRISDDFYFFKVWTENVNCEVSVVAT